MGLGSRSEREGCVVEGYRGGHCGGEDVSELQQPGPFNIGPALQSRNPLTASMEEAQVIGNIPIRYEARLLNTAGCAWANLECFLIPDSSASR